MHNPLLFVSGFSLLTVFEGGASLCGSFGWHLFAPPPFSHQACWQPLSVFLGKVGLVSERRWKQIILNFKKVVDDEDMDVDLQADASMISAYQAEIYIPSSPMKA